ncbi:hypothetical protein [Phenylobacterium montanum]|uniref:Uncharacterized protein n=1 Tax=Phenylobacterium montanum TaxID=2823693 RepID=A0A975IT75_9CAUL|nr:hypothetical protein [Caulobacter sp. S6]QUD86189.1 hypothetical protein KCG34_13875 [Caulobacter sp. S6]
MHWPDRELPADWYNLNASQISDPRVHAVSAELAHVAQFYTYQHIAIAIAAAGLAIAALQGRRRIVLSGFLGGFVLPFAMICWLFGVHRMTRIGMALGSNQAVILSWLEPAVLAIVVGTMIRQAWLHHNRNRTT